jgi:hypothetical protein
MKVEFEDWDQGCDISLIPETVEEAASLMRVAQNTKREPAFIRFYFKKKTYLNIFMRKRATSVQKHEITNR